LKVPRGGTAPQQGVENLGGVFEVSGKHFLRRGPIPRDRRRFVFFGRRAIMTIRKGLCGGALPPLLPHTSTKDPGQGNVHKKEKASVGGRTPRGSYRRKTLFQFGRDWFLGGGGGTKMGPKGIVIGNVPSGTAVFGGAVLPDQTQGKTQKGERFVIASA